MTVRRGLVPRLLPALVSALGLLGALVLSSCGTPSQQQEDEGAGAGVSATVGGVDLLNLLIVAGEEGGQGIICGAGDNTVNEQRSVQIRLESGAGTTLTVPPQGYSDLNCQSDDPVVLREVPVPPGALADVTLSAAGEQTVARVPVLYPYSDTPYGPLAPPGFTTSPTAGRTNSP